MEERINIGNSATEVVTALSEYGDFSADMSATEFVGEVNTAFPDAEASVNDSTTTLVGKINNAYVPDDDMKVLKFLHVSDTHNLTGSNFLGEAIAQMNNDDGILALIHTGDIAYQSIINSIEANKSVLKPLSVIGNHDAKDLYNKDVVAMRTNMSKINDGVTWGNMTPKTEEDTDYYGCYWSKDYWVDEKHTKRLRIIGLDQYNYTENDPSGGSTYTNCLSQVQVNWFIEQITSLGKNDYFIVCMHDAPWYCSPSYRRKNDWCSSRLWASAGSYIPTTFFASVINAYLKGIDTRVNKITGKTYKSKNPETVEVGVDFSQYTTPATFLCYLCGHEHGDYHGYHPSSSFNDQLLFCIDTSQGAPGGNNSDIRVEDMADGATRGSGSGYLRNCISSNPGNGILMNLVTLDFARKTITLSRIGQYKACEHSTSKGFKGDSDDPKGQSYTYPAVERTTITFPFKKTQS